MHFRFWVHDHRIDTELRILRSDWIVHPPSFPLRSFLAYRMSLRPKIKMKSHPKSQILGRYDLGRTRYANITFEI